MNKENIAKIANHIRSLPYMKMEDWIPEAKPAFNMNEYNFRHVDQEIYEVHPTSSMGSSTECNTPACLAGWTVELLAPESDEFDPEVLAQDLFGISDKQAETLFRPNNEYAGFDVENEFSPRFIGPKRMADVLDNFVATGEIDWTINNVFEVSRSRLEKAMDYLGIKYGVQITREPDEYVTRNEMVDILLKYLYEYE